MSGAAITLNLGVFIPVSVSRQPQHATRGQWVFRDSVSFGSTGFAHIFAVFFCWLIVVAPIILRVLIDCRAADVVEQPAGLVALGFPRFFAGLVFGKVF